VKSIPERTFEFGVIVVKLVADLPRTSAGYAIASQLVRSGTSIGANVEEAQNAPTKKEFVHTMTIALREARETGYWLRMIKEAKILNYNLDQIIQENLEIVRILTSSIKSIKKHL
jgi:four helix bundle protein